MALPHPQCTPAVVRPGLYDPAQERDACGVAFVADLHGRRSHDVVAKGLSALIRLDHRGARGAEYNTGDGAGIMIQVPDAFYRAVADFELPPAGYYATGLVFLPERRRRPPARADQGLREVRPGRGRRGARLAGRAGGPVRAGRHRRGGPPADPAGLPRRAPAHRRAGRPGRRAAERPRPGPGGVLHPQAGRAGDVAARRRRRTSRRCPSRTITYKGMLTPDQLPAFFPDLTDERVDSAIALVHSRFSTNTFPSLAAGPPVPVHRAQRRDQHDPRQQELDAGPRGAAAVARSLPGNIKRLFPISRRRRPTRPASTRCWSCCTWPGAACRTRC